MINFFINTIFDKKIFINHLHKSFKQLANILEGELYTDVVYRTLYATDASAYKEMPVAVAIPRSIADLEKLVVFANNNNVPLIPRGAGTSLAGQVVGSGLVVDMSKYLNRVLEINAEERWVRVEPGVVLAELNLVLKPHGLQFGPETSTANRCTMGGMLGNNSCGLHSLVHGSVREHIIETEAILSDSSKVVFKSLSSFGFEEKCRLSSLEGALYRHASTMLSNDENRKEIETQFPHPSVPRRNHGYAIDILAKMQPFDPNGEAFNFSKLIAGSEGTLALVTSMKLHLDPLPPEHKALLCVHFSSLVESFKANLIALKYNPSAIELMDKTIMDLTKGNIGLARNRSFIRDEPEAILIIELWGGSKDQIEDAAAQIETEMREAGYSFHFPLVWGADIPRVWGLRTAGLGVLSNIPGDAKPVSVIEDTAVPVHLIPDYLSEFGDLMKRMKLESVYHAHIATGELHLRPILNLKDHDDVVKFREVATETARLVKKYKGSLSGEHGDGRLRGEFIPFMYGEKVYCLLKELKNVWDPRNLFNPGKITATPAMDQSLRFEP
jgi:FAD/FMN-containing dehydrogenase